MYGLSQVLQVRANPSSNAAPTASDGAVTTPEDTDYVFTPADFGFMDTDSGDSLVSLKIVTPPAAGKGTMKFDNGNVSANATVPFAELNGGSLRYAPPANANGTGYASFTFKVNDGMADSASAYTMTINVTAVNDDPTVENALPDIALLTGPPFSYTFPQDTFNDVESGISLTYMATQADDTALPVWLSFNASTRTFSGTPQLADVGTVSVKVTATDGTGGSGSDTFDITVSLGLPLNGNLTPTGLAVGDKFRLLFLSSTKRNASSGDIADYNTFIQNRAAAGHADIRAFSSIFRALGCTTAVDARDNTSTTYTATDKGVPIYWLGGTRVADDYEDFYDGSWDDEANDKNESGTDGPDTSESTNRPITGCNHDGTEDFNTGGQSRALGNSTNRARVGRPASTDSAHGPIDGNAVTSTSNDRPMYGLSAVFQVGATRQTATAPGAPTSLTATASGSTTINLSWTAPDSDGGAAITGYKIEVSTDGGTSFTDLVANTNSTGTTYAHTGLAAGTTRHYQVSAINSVGTGTASNVANATTATEVASNWSLKPTGLAVGSSFRLLFLSSTKRDATSTDIADYNTFVQTRAAAGHTDIQTHSAGFRVVGCTEDVDARDNTATTYTATDKGVPIYWLNGAKAADDYEDFYDGSWDDEANDKNESGTGPNTDLAADMPFTGCDHDGTEAFFNTTSEALGTMNVQVARPNASSTGSGPLSSPSRSLRTVTRPMYGLSQVFQVKAAANTVPGAPTNLTATASGTATINLSWTAPVNDGGAAITGYKIEVSTDGGTTFTDLVANTNSTGTTYAHTGLAAGSTRHYQVSAINSVGTGTASNVANATTEAPANTAPGAPTNLTATASGTATINLSWTAPVNDGGAAITGYKIEVSTDGGTTFTDLVANTNSTGTTYAHTGLAAGSTRHYQVSAINSVGTGTASNVANATTDTNEGNAAPTVANAIPDLQAEVGVRFSFIVPANAFSDPDDDVLTYAAMQADDTPLPAWLSFAAGTRSFSGTPGSSDAGTVLVKVTASDGKGGSVSDTFTLTVGDVGNLEVDFGTFAAADPIEVRESTTSSHRFTVHLNSEPARPVTVPLAVTHVGGATEADYTGLPASVTFAAGKRVADFSIRAIPDEESETGEGLRLDFGQLPSGVRKGTWGPYETIEFVDEPDARTVWFGAEAYTATEGGADATVSIHLDAPVEVEPLEVRLLLAYAGGATAEDHGPIPTHLRFAVGERTKTVTVTATDDTDDDDGESVSLSFAHDLSGRVTGGGGAITATVALEDDEGPAPVTVSFGAATYTATEGGDAATVSVVLDAAPGRSVTVPLTTSHRGGATGADYSGIPANVTFGANETARTFAVSATSDGDADGGESVSIGFGDLPDGVFAGTPATAVVTVSDGNEQALVVNFDTFVGSAPTRLREGGGSHWISVLLDGTAERPVTIPLEVTHTNGATQDDHTPVPATVTIAAGKYKWGFSMRAIADQEAETGEGVRLDFGELPPGVTKSTWAPYKRIEFEDDVQASVSGPVLTLAYPGALDGSSAPSARDFVVSAVASDGARGLVAVAAVSVRGSDVTLDLARPVAADETVALTYLAASMHPIRATGGLPVPPLADQPVRNDTGASDPPADAATAVGNAPEALRAALDAAAKGIPPVRLDLSSRNLADVSALAGLTGLRELDLRDNAIENLGPLAGLTGLSVLDVSGNRVEDLLPLTGLKALERLYLADNRIADLTPLAGLDGLRALDVSGNRISDLWALTGLKALGWLNLSGNRLGELAPLAGLANLGLSENGIADVGALAGLGGLRRLDLSGNAVAEVWALGDVSGMVWLRLSGNPVSSAAALVRLENLRWLWLDPGTAPGIEAIAAPAGRGEARPWIEIYPAR